MKTKIDTDDQTYLVTQGYYQFFLHANFAEASDPIQWADPEEETWQSTPFQVADARHSPTVAAKLVAEWTDSDDETEIDSVEPYAADQEN